MAIGSLLGLTPDLSNKLARVHLIPLSNEGTPDTEIGKKGLPFWPETISDSKGATWEEKAVPGGSHPIYQWVSGTARTIGFTIVLSRDSQNVDPAEETDDVHNIDVAAAIAWLRSMTYPLYEDTTVKNPPVMLMVFPGSQIGGPDNHEVLCIMTQCDVEYQAFFNDGEPRHATVSVSFNEVIQIPNGPVVFSGRDTLKPLADKYLLDPDPGTH